MHGIRFLLIISSSFISSIYINFYFAYMIFSSMQALIHKPYILNALGLVLKHLWVLD